MNEKYMEIAYLEAKKAYKKMEVPVGAVIVKDNKVISKAHNLTETKNDCTKHAEIIAIKKASKKLKNWRLIDCDLYVTLEPCTMCAGAISLARIKNLYFGATDAKGGAVISGVKFFEAPTCHHRPQVSGGILEEECAALLKNFFRQKRNKKDL